MPTRTIVLELSEEQTRWIDERVAAGKYADSEAALRAALDDNMIDDILERMPPQQELDAIFREALARHEADPSGDMDLDEAFDRLAAELAVETGR